MRDWMQDQMGDAEDWDWEFWDEWEFYEPEWVTPGPSDDNSSPQTEAEDLPF